MVMLYMVTFTINIPHLCYHIYHTWILWAMEHQTFNIIQSSPDISRNLCMCLADSLRIQQERLPGTILWSWCKNRLVFGCMPWTQEVSNNIAFPTFCPLGPRSSTKHHWRLDGTKAKWQGNFGAAHDLIQTIDGNQFLRVWG